jgi:hypothetical protein
MSGPMAKPTRYRDVGRTSRVLSLGILKYSEISSFAPEGRDDPKAVLNINKIPAATMCNFLPYVDKLVEAIVVFVHNH